MSLLKKTLRVKNLACSCFAEVHGQFGNSEEREYMPLEAVN
jgi:hypothetical protein